MCILCYMLNNPAPSDGEIGKLLLKYTSKKIFLYKLLKINKVVLCYPLLKLVERNEHLYLLSELRRKIASQTSISTMLEGSCQCWKQCRK